MASRPARKAENKDDSRAPVPDEAAGGGLTCPRRRGSVPPEMAGAPAGKPVVGIVATFGDIPLANSDWYFNSFILDRAQSKLKPPIYPSTSMLRRPIVIQLQTLEDFVTLLNHTGASPISLYDEWQELPYIRAGDWDAFLRKKLEEQKGNVSPLEFVESEFYSFFEGIAGEHFPEAERGPGQIN